MIEKNKPTKPMCNFVGLVEIHNASFRINDYLPAFTALSTTEQRVATTIYQLLAETGKPLSVTKVAERIGQSAGNLDALLKCWPEVKWQDTDTISGYAGLSTTKTKHQFQVEGNLLYTWCAWDCLFIPTHLQKEVCIESHCPQSQTVVSLKMKGYRVLEQSMKEIYVSLIKPGSTLDLKNIENQYCCHVHFLAGHDAAERWQTNHPECVFFTLETAIVLAQHHNKNLFPALVIQ
jgi:alkylmercury lyase